MRTLANATQQQLHATGIPSVEYIAGISATETHYAAIVEALSRQGHFGLIDDPKTLDVTPLKQKSATLHWEFMFTRSLYQTADIAAHGKLLSDTASLIDSGRTDGKLVLAGF